MSPEPFDGVDLLLPVGVLLVSFFDFDSLLLLDLERDLLFDTDFVFFEFFPSLFSSSEISCLDSSDSEYFFGIFFLPKEVNFLPFLWGAFFFDWAVAGFAVLGFCSFFFTEVGRFLTMGYFSLG